MVLEIQIEFQMVVRDKAAQQQSAAKEILPAGVTGAAKQKDPVIVDMLLLN